MAVAPNAGDVDLTAGDPADVPVYFRDSAGHPLNLSMSTLTLTMRAIDSPVLTAVDAVHGEYHIRLTEDQTRNMLPMVTWDIFETPQFNRTILRGRFNKVEDVVK